MVSCRLLQKGIPGALKDLHSVQKGIPRALRDLYRFKTGLLEPLRISTVPRPFFEIPCDAVRVQTSFGNTLWYYRSKPFLEIPCDALVFPCTCFLRAVTITMTLNCYFLNERGPKMPFLYREKWVSLYTLPMRVMSRKTTKLVSYDFDSADRFIQIRCRDVLQRVYHKKLVL